MQFYSSNSLGNYLGYLPNDYTQALESNLGRDLNAKIENEHTIHNMGYAYLALIADNSKSKYASRITTESWNVTLIVGNKQRRMAIRRRVVDEDTYYEAKIQIGKDVSGRKRSIEVPLTSNEFYLYVGDEPAQYVSTKTRISFDEAGVLISADFTSKGSTVEVDVTFDLDTTPSQSAVNTAVNIESDILEEKQEDAKLPPDQKAEYIATSLVTSALHNGRLPRPVDVRLNNLVNGGLASDLYKANNVNPNHALVNNGTGYAVSCKSDGEHALLVIAEDNVFLVNMSNMLLAWFTYDGYSSKTVLEGELVHNNFILFDALLVDQEDVTNKDYISRITVGRNFTSKASIPGLTFADKSIVTLTHEFSAGMKSILERCENSQFGNDGIIFTPINTSYMDQSSKYPIYKWKPLDMLTIDARVTATGSLYVGDTIEGRIQDVPLNSIWPNSYEVLSVPDGLTGVMEFTIQIGDTDTLTYFRYRPDKVHPNKASTVLSIRKLHEAPITSETLVGTDNTKLRRSHNMIKRLGYTKTHDIQAVNIMKSTSNQKRILLDLGGGRGGDISKYRGLYDHIYVVEPNAENISEYRSRIPEDLVNRITLIQAQAEDTEAIQEVMQDTKASTVSLMLSLTFFGETMQQLVYTIKQLTAPNYVLMVLTMDRDRFLKYESQVTNTTLADTTIKRVSDNRIHVHINDSIVTDQYEYLVTIADLLQALGYPSLASTSNTLAKEDRPYSTSKIEGSSIEALPVSQPIMLLSEQEALINALYVGQVISIAEQGTSANTRASNLSKSIKQREITTTTTGKKGASSSSLHARTPPDISEPITIGDDTSFYRVGTINYPSYQLLSAFLQAISSKFASTPHNQRNQMVTSAIRKVSKKSKLNETELLQKFADMSKTRLVVLQQVGNKPNDLQYYSEVLASEDENATVYLILYGGSGSTNVDILAYMITMKKSNMDYTLLTSKFFDNELGSITDLVDDTFNVPE